MAISEQNRAIIERIKQTDLNRYENLNYMFQMARNVLEEDRGHALKISGYVKRKAMELISSDVRFYGLYRKALLFEAPHLFDSYLLYMEIDRDPGKRFYLPRRKQLKVLVDDLQDLEEGVITFLGVSMPSRTGKSTLCIFFLTWAMGRSPDMANLMSGHSDKLTKGFYKETLNFIASEEYKFHDIFPGVFTESKSAEDEALNLNNKTRFPTLTCRSIDGTLTGAVEAENYLYCDDLVRDRTESLNAIRLENRYQDYLNVLVDRKKESAKELMIGTRWNVLDPLGRIEKQYKDNPLYRFRKIPALDENGKSNFEYDYNKGFSTEYFKAIQERLDKNEWMAKYQQNPFIREGLLFPEDELRTYNGVLPEDGLVRKVAVCDVAFGGGDSLSMPFAYEYEDGRVYIPDVIFNTGTKDITRPIVIGRTKQHMPHMQHYEANNGGDAYAEYIDTELQKDGVKINISWSKAPNNKSKLARIIQYTPEIKTFYFLDQKHRNPEYQKFMDELTMFVQIGNNEHDDAPDALAQLAAFLTGGMIAKCEAMQRPF